MIGRIIYALPIESTSTLQAPTDSTFSIRRVSSTNAIRASVPFRSLFADRSFQRFSACINLCLRLKWHRPRQLPSPRPLHHHRPLQLIRSLNPNSPMIRPPLLGVRRAPAVLNPVVWVKALCHQTICCCTPFAIMIWPVSKNSSLRDTRDRRPHRYVCSFSLSCDRACWV